MIRKIVLAAMISAAIGSVSMPANAVLVIRTAPPPPRAEAVPEPRRGYVWVGGHWEWKNQHHHWIKGSWLRERPGYRYNPPTWVEHEGRWRMDRGNWRRGDRDGDGVPNSRDQAPNDPHRQ